MHKPAIGRIVHTFVDPGTNNGSDIAPAVITRVWGDETVNLKVLLDGHDNPWLTSVKLLPGRPPAEALTEDAATFVCFWPPIV